MEHSDILVQARLAYFLGNFGRVLEIWQQNDDQKIQDNDYYYFIVSRAIIASRELKPKTVSLTKKPSQKLLEITDIVGRLMLPLIKPQKASTTIEEDRRILEDGLKKIKENISPQNQKIMQLVCAYISVNSCEANYALNLELPKDAFQQELLFLQLMLFLRGRRFDLAEQALLNLKRYDDEDILSYLGQIYQNMLTGAPDLAIKNIDETKERFGESAKLINLKVSCLISLNKFDEALELGMKLQQALVEKEQFSDRMEIEVCLSNLTLLSEISNKLTQKEEFLQLLQSVNPASPFLKRYAERLAKIEYLMK